MKGTPRFASALSVAHAVPGRTGRSYLSYLSLIPALVLVALTLAPRPAAGQPLPPEPPTLANPVPTPPSGQPIVAPSPSAAPILDPVVAPTGASQPLIRIDLGAGDQSGSEGGLAPVLKIILLLVAMTFIPALLLSMTSFTRIIIVLSMLRQGVGVAQLPPNRVLTALALFLTAFTMAPVFAEVNEKAIAPYQAGKLDERGALEAAAQPLREFMLRHTREADLMLFMDIAKDARPQTSADVPIVTLAAAFILSELKTAFQMGALLFLPFLIIDIVVASLLMSMGMMMLTPATIALPLKILMFVAVDGWGMVIGSLAKSIRG